MSFAVKKQKYLELLSWQGGGVQRMIYPPWRPGASEGQEGQKGKGAPGEGEKGVKGPYEGLGEGGEDVELAVLLQHLNALKGLCSTSEFNALCALLTLERLDSHPDYANWSVQQGRWGCFNALRGVLWRVLPGQNDDAYAIANGGNGSAKGDVGDAGAAWAGATGLMRMVSMSLSYQAAVDPSQAFREHGTWDQGGRYDAELGYLVPHMEGTGAGARAGAGTGAGAGAGAGAGTGVRTRAGDGSERVLEPMGYMGSPTSATTTTTTLAELSGGSNGGPDILPTPRQPATPPPALSFAPSPAPMPIPAADFISVPSVPSVPWDSKGHTEERERERESVVVDGDGEYVVVALPDREAEAQVGRLGVGGRLVYTPREPVAWTVGQAGEDGVGEGSESAGMQRTLVARQGVQGAHELVQGVQGLGVQSESPESRGEPSAFTVDVGGQKVRAMPPALKRRMQAEREAEERRQLEADDARERERAGSRGRSRSSSRASASSSAIPAPRPTSAHRARVGMGGVGGGGEEVRRSQSSGGVRRSGERLSVGGKAPAPGAPGAPVARGARPHNEETGLGERGRGMGGMDLSRAHPAEPPQEQEREQVREQVLRPRLLYESKCPLRCASLLYSSEGRTTLAVGSNGKTVHVLSYGGLGGAGAVVERDLANIHKGSVYALDWNPELGLIASGSNDKSIRLSK
ncbi:hypothetical protein B484DRAFT_407203 [Ochromonadaceae sp. CCMP2298]|nr:hypothetical protein B484DRAFT_407203 [Ochromonadaceae sp. CCMP2298]